MAIALTENQWVWLKDVAELTLLKQTLPDDIALRLSTLGLIEERIGGVFGLTAAGRTVVATVTARRGVMRAQARLAVQREWKTS